MYTEVKDLRVGDVVTWGSKEYNYVYKGNGQGSCDKWMNGRLHTLPEDGLILVDRKKIMKLRDLKVGDRFYFLPIEAGEIVYTYLDEDTLQWYSPSVKSIKTCLSKYYLSDSVQLVESGKMNIIEALQAMKNGKKVKKVGWSDGLYLQIKNNMICNAKGTFDNSFSSDMTVKWEEYVEPLVEVQLNSEYKAVLSKDKIKVGCQEFTYDKLDELVNASKKFR